MKDCNCDDGIGQYVCAKHSTPQNDPFHWLLHAKVRNVGSATADDTAWEEEWQEDEDGDA